jgi:hypothetical protein
VSGPARAALDAFLALDLARWPGLPSLSPADVERALGVAPGPWEPVVLGWEPALRAALPAQTPSGGVAAYQRAGTVVMLEALAPPSVETVQALGEPDAVLPHEVRSQRGYVHEQLYAGRGLIVGMLQPFDGGPHEPVRCRGIVPLLPGSPLDPGLYRSAEDQVLW